jgi:ABC-type phosphate transport system substrate-binding protein
VLDEVISMPTIFPLLRLWAVVASLAGLLAGPALGRTEEFKIVASPGSPPAAMKRQDVARLFLKKTTRWPDGQPVVPVDQSSHTAVRAAFTRSVLKVEGLGQLSAVQSYWQEVLFSGRGIPPTVKSNDAEVLTYILATPGAIGYVSAGADLGAAKIVSVVD